MRWNMIIRALRSRRSQKGSRSLRCKPTVEMLEDRRLLSLTTSVFLVDASNSALTLSGTIGGFAIQPQGNGSLTGSYSGAIVADWDLDGLTVNLDQSGTTLSANITGDWQPKPDGTSGTAPANYGGKLTILFLTAEVAIRNLTLATPTASPLPLSGTGPYSFASSETFTVLTGEADYNAGAIGTGSADLSALSAQ